MKKQVKQYVFMSHDINPETWRREWTPILREYKPQDSPSQIFVGEQLVTIEFPDDFDPVPAQVAALEAEKRQAMNAYQQKVAEINEQLSKLQALEFTA